jgi:antitoxin ParD1/3/4
MDERVDLGRDIISIVDEVMETGNYVTREDALLEGMKLLQLREQKRAEFIAAIEEGIADADAGRVIDAEDLLREMNEKFGEMARPNSA